MSKFKFLLVAGIAAATVAGPAMARERHQASRYVTQDAFDSMAPGAPYVGAPACIPAPRVGAFASAPWTNGNAPCEPGTGY